MTARFRPSGKHFVPGLVEPFISPGREPRQPLGCVVGPASAVRQLPHRTGYFTKPVDTAGEAAIGRATQGRQRLQTYPEVGKTDDCTRIFDQEKLYRTYAS